jgi:aspartyl-tRNA synthetase
MFEFNEEDGRFYAMHHPFTSPKKEDIHQMEKDLGAVKANAYDLVLNGTEIAGGSIRIHDKQLQANVFEVLGFSRDDAMEKFGFLMNAFEFGAPPHGGIAFGFDRLCALMGGSESIRDFIAFPKNNAGKDMMIDSPSPVDQTQLKELHIQIKN